jgi:hypothetical protein
VVDRGPSQLFEHDYLGCSQKFSRKHAGHGVLWKLHKHGAKEGVFGRDLHSEAQCSALLASFLLPRYV